LCWIDDNLKDIKMKKRVLFVCTHNSARSQMAEGLLRSLYDDKYEVFSAGTKPSKVNPNAIEVMEEIGIDISSHYSKNVKDFINEDFDYVITFPVERNKYIKISKTRLPFPAVKKKYYQNLEKSEIN